MTRPDTPPYGIKLDAWGMPACDGTHPECCAHIDKYRAHRDAKLQRQNASNDDA